MKPYIKIYEDPEIDTQFSLGFRDDDCWFDIQFYRDKTAGFFFVSKFDEIIGKKAIDELYGDIEKETLEQLYQQLGKFLEKDS